MVCVLEEPGEVVENREGEDEHDAESSPGRRAEGSGLERVADDDETFNRHQHSQVDRRSLSH